MAKSLLDDAAFENIGKSRSVAKSSGKSGGDAVKLFLAIGLLLVAGGLLAWYTGVLDGLTGGSKTKHTVQLTPEEQKSYQQQEAQRQKDALNKDVTVGGS